MSPRNLLDSKSLLPKLPSHPRISYKPKKMCPNGEFSIRVFPAPEIPVVSQVASNNHLLPIKLHTLHRNSHHYPHLLRNRKLVFPKIVVPQNGWFIRENSLELMIWGYHYFWKHPNMKSSSKDQPTRKGYQRGFTASKLDPTMWKSTKNITPSLPLKSVYSMGW